MNDISIVSHITAADVLTYLRVEDPDTSDTTLVTSLISAAKAYMCKYTGLVETDLDDSPDFGVCLLLLVQGAYDVRAAYVDKSNVNPAIDSILSMHSVNLL